MSIQKQKIREKIEKMIHAEKNPHKREMLHSVFDNNINYAKEKDDFLRLGNIIEAMKTIDRRHFAPSSEAIYSDMPLPIGHGQTISQPTTVARMLLLAKMKPGMDVLEIGGGSGWNASLASKLISPAKILSVERIKPLALMAVRNFDRMLKESHLKLHAKFTFADALDEKSEVWRKKYDRIIVTAGANAELAAKLHEMAEKLLKEGGLLVYPTSEHGIYGSLEVWQSKNKKLSRLSREEGYSFVPLLKGKEK